MKHLAFIIAFIFTLKTLKSQQNLVPNWSFEDTLNCGVNINPAMVPTPWYNPNQASPDYYTANWIYGCGTWLNDPDVGYQMPKTGLAYIGLFCYEYYGTRDYYAVKLLDSLKVGKKYKIKFWASLANGASYQVDRLGAYLSKDSVLLQSAFNINVVPQVQTQSGILLTDTVNWFKIEGEYFAQGGEQFITIGNFYDNANTLVDSIYGIQPNFNAGYYFIDDVEVIEDTSLSVHEIGSNKCYVRFELNDAIELNFESNCSIGQISIWSNDGKIVYQSESELSNSNIEFHSKLAKGIYFIRIIYLNNITQVSKLFINH